MSNSNGASCIVNDTEREVHQEQAIEGGKQQQPVWCPVSFPVGAEGGNQVACCLDLAAQVHCDVHDCDNLANLHLPICSGPCLPMNRCPHELPHDEHLKHEHQNANDLLADDIQDPADRPLTYEQDNEWRSVCAHVHMHLLWLFLPVGPDQLLLVLAITVAHCTRNLQLPAE